MEPGTQWLELRWGFTMKFPIRISVLVALVMLCLPAGAATTNEEIQGLKEQVSEIQKDIAEIKKLLEEGAGAPARPQAPTFQEQVFSVEGSPFKGQEDAPVTVVEFSDYGCPFCARHYRDVLPKLEEEYIEAGKVKFVMREYPIPSLHKDAIGASQAALCAGDQGKYWEMHDIMFDNQKELGTENLKDLASQIGLDTSQFNECLEGEKYAKQVRDDMAAGSRLGVSGTPGFFIGLTDPEDPDQVNLSVYIRGAQAIDTFRANIDSLLDNIDEG